MRRSGETQAVLSKDNKGLRKMTEGSTTSPQARRRLVVASHNAGKVVEIRGLLAPYGLDAVSAGELGLPEPEETGETYAENAALKARAAAEASGLPALADDSGLSVEALGGAPGIYSARWAGPERDFGLAMQKVEAALAAAGTSNRRASFLCVLAWAEPGGEVELYEGRVDGTLVFPPRGANGFGYDPIFVAHGETITFGEMDPARKHAMSHRARAFEKLTTARTPR
jgi:XTP/dITP diphosphohydrolase